MRALILYNPHSGRGRGQRTAESVAAMLRSTGGTPTLLGTAKEPPDAFHARLRAALAGQNLLIVAGGDGTLHHTLPSVVGSGVPLYHLAMGTENLFARQFAMDGSPATLERAVKAWRTLDIDVATLTLDGDSPRPFVLMCSIGPDAGVIRRLDAARSGPISHLSYVRPIVAELLAPSLPRLTVEVDGRKVIDDQPGMCVVANSRHYAMRIDPALNASMTDGLLDVVFFPSAGRVSLAAWMLKSRFRKHLGKPLTYVSAGKVRITAPNHRGPAPAYQVDGECGRHTFPKGVELNIDVVPKALKLLAP
ncbi:MAG TPA: diacylglycerol kinase family protein [Phycisphaerales bacterium]|nr:diacylglycerol kinase family protein [Phycisphaerales bacterium]